jgi:hypothetical protein
LGFFYSVAAGSPVPESASNPGSTETTGNEGEPIVASETPGQPTVERKLCFFSSKIYVSDI